MVVFFFKQKTAYDMRISDWSSDVCSSDLADIYGPSQPRLMATEGERPQAQDQKLIPIDSRYGIPMLSLGHLVKPGQAIAWRGKIGRASCRARVCQYV